MHATTKMANLAKNRQRAGENLNEAEPDVQEAILVK